jgi:hypothetical protein
MECLLGVPSPRMVGIPPTLQQAVTYLMTEVQLARRKVAGGRVPLPRKYGSARSGRIDGREKGAR